MRTVSAVQIEVHWARSSSWGLLILSTWQEMHLTFYLKELRVRLARHDNHDYLPLIVIISIIAITDDECAFGCNHNHDFLIVIICL